jgi:hypothetical protein
MLIISLILSTLLLLIANGFARYGSRTGAVVACSTLGVLAIFLFLPLLALVLQAILLCAVTWFWRATRRTPASFFRLSCAATAVAYVPFGLMALASEREYASLRARYPYESLAGRLPTPRPASVDAALAPATIERLSHLEAAFPEGANSLRGYQLELLHDRAVSLFINGPGFGISRMSRPSEEVLATNPRGRPVPPQPGPRLAPEWSSGEFRQPSADDDVPLGRLLDDSILDFADPRGLGYFKDRDHVAGFEAHQFSQVPAPASRWKVGNVELVSLLLHDEPEVYVSPELPRMDRVREIPTRPLDRFEEFALHALRRGEDIVSTEAGGGIRMLGAVRGIGHCIACHDVPRGALLGAFSYTLRPDEPQSRPADR